MKKIIIINFLFLLMLSCREGEILSFQIDYPDACRSGDCVVELIFEKEGKIFYRDKQNYQKSKKIDLPHEVQLNGSKVNINIFIKNEIKYYASGELGKTEVFLPLPLNGSRVVASLNYRRYLHSQFLHSSGNVIIVGGYNTIYDSYFEDQKSYEKTIEIYNVHSHKLRLFPRKLNYGKIQPKIHALEDDRILLLPGVECSFPEIIDIKNEKIETIEQRGGNFIYLGGNLIFFENDDQEIIIYNFKKKSIISRHEPENNLTSIKTIFKFEEGIYFLGRNPWMLDLKSFKEIRIMENSFTPLDFSSYSLTIIGDRIFFINNTTGSDVVYRLYPNLLKISESNIYMPNYKKGNVLESIGDFLIISGEIFEIINTIDGGRIEYSVFEERSSHALLRINSNQFFLSGGINGSTKISTAIEIFLLKGEGQ